MKVDRKFHQCFLLSLLLIITINTNAQDDKTLYEGKFKADSYFTTFEGSWKIVQSSDQTYVIFGSDFDAKKAPDLQIFLSKQVLDDINGKNATTAGSPLLVAKLTKFKGTARFKVPGNTDISAYRSIIVHCVEYSKLWGGAKLQ